MKKNKLLLLATISVFAMTLGACNQKENTNSNSNSQKESESQPSSVTPSSTSSEGQPSESESSEPAQVFSIRFLNYDSTVLQEDLLAEGAIPEYRGDTPLKPGNAQYHYVFNDWDKEIVPVVAAADYTATFTEVINSFTVTFMSDEDTVYTTQNVDYGQKATRPEDPTKEATAEKIFFFDGWKLNDAEFDFDTLITEDITLMAAWDSASATEHGDKCTYTHYPYKEPTYVQNGYKEFWYCELHKNFTLESPAVYKKINEATGPYTGYIPSTDERYLPALEGGNLYMSLDLGAYKDGDAMIRTEDMLDTVLSVTFRYRLRNATKTSWMGFSVNQNLIPSCYEEDAEEWVVFQPSYDGLWHEQTIEFASTPNGYLTFVHASGEFEEGALLDLDNFYIECGGDEFKEDFQSTNMFVSLSELARLDGEEQLNNFIRTNISSSPELALVISKKSYTNIASVTFKYRLSENAILDGHLGWGHLMISSDGEQPGIYADSPGILAWKDTSPADDGEWHKKTIEINGSGYIAFGVESHGYADGATMDYDDIVVNYGEGRSDIDNCDDVLKFKPTADETHALRFSLASEPYPEEELPGPRFCRVDVGSYLAGASLVHTVSQLEGITSITFKARVHGGVDHGNPWWGFGVNSYYDGDAIYQGMHTVSYDFDDEWHEYSISISSANGYVNFIQASGEFSSGSYIDLDDIVITYNGGAKLEETFDNGVILSLDDSFTKVLKY